MKKNCIFLLLLFTSVCACKDNNLGTYGGENTFIKFYGYNGNNRGVKSFQADDGGYVILGNTDFANRSNIFLAKTDASGNEIWSDSFSIKTYTQANSMEIDENGTYIILATSAPSSPLVTSDSVSMHLIRISQQGDIDASFNVRFQSDTSQLVGSELAKAKNGDYLIVGNNITNLGNDVLFIRTDMEGNTILTRTYGFSTVNNKTQSDIIESSSGNIIWVGTINNGSSVEEDMSIIRLNNSGNPEWNFEFGSAGNQSGIAIADVGDGFVGIGNDELSEKIFLQKINAQGQSLWSITLPTDNSQVVGNDISFSQDGGLIFVGNITTSNGTQIYLAKIKGTGSEELLISEQFGGGGSNTGNDVIETSDNGLLITGTIQFEGNAVIALIKTNPQGQVSQ